MSPKQMNLLVRQARSARDGELRARHWELFAGHLMPATTRVEPVEARISISRRRFVMKGHPSSVRCGAHDRTLSGTRQ